MNHFINIPARKQHRDGVAVRRGTMPPHKGRLDTYLGVVEDAAGLVTGMSTLRTCDDGATVTRGHAVAHADRQGPHALGAGGRRPLSPPTPRSSGCIDGGR